VFKTVDFAVDMPVDPDVLRSRISEVRLCLSELRRLVLRPFKELSLDIPCDTT
jgi:hypothetical protein